MHPFSLPMINPSYYSRLILISAILFVMQVSVSCQQKVAEKVVEKPIRDTTITVSNAYSTLFVDSLAVESFINSESQNPDLANYLRNFYASRNYSFAWFDEEGLTEHAQAFWEAHNNVVRHLADSTIYDRALHEVIDTLQSEDSAYQLDQSSLNLTELRLTKHVYQYVQFAYSGTVDPKEVQWHIPRRKLQPAALINTFLNSEKGEWKGLSSSYRKLQKALFRFNEIKQKGGWMQLASPQKLHKPAATAAYISQLKKRLQQSGDYREGDTSEIYSTHFVVAVKKMQAAFGQEPNGVIDKALIKQLNVPVEERIAQMLLNLERMKWMPEEPANYLLANIPEYRLHVMESGKEVLAMNVVVGKAVHRTVVFSDELKYVVFSPYWNIPRSIVKNEIYPAMKSTLR